MDYYEIVTKLAGPITSTGRHEVDTMRRENLLAIQNVVDRLVMDLIDLRGDKDSHEASVKYLGMTADEFLRDLYDTLDATLEDEGDC